MAQAKPVLQLAEPEPVELEVEFGAESRTLRLRPISLRDAAWAQEKFKRTLAESVFQDNDVSDAVRVFVHQLMEDDLKWMCRKLKTTPAMLPDRLIDACPADPDEENPMAGSIIHAVLCCHSKSYPEQMQKAVEEQVAEQKKSPSVSLRLAWTKLSATFACGLAAGYGMSILF